jgi:hypothetical protein
MSTPFKELPGSPTESYGPYGMTAQRQLICAWQDRNTFVQEILGSGYVFGGTSPVSYPGVADVLATSVQVVPLTDDMIKQTLSGLTTGLNSYHGFAKVTVKYILASSSALSTGVLQEVAPQTYLTYRMELGYDSVTFPGGDLLLPGNPQVTFPADAQGTLQLPVTHHRLTWHRVLNPPWTAIRQTSGAWNDAEFLGAAAGTLLFDGANAEREFLSLSELNEPQYGWNIEYSFRENCLALQSSQNLFRTADFSALLQFEE